MTQVECLRILITGASGQVAYSMLQPIACGVALGHTQKVHIVMFDLPVVEDVMKGVAAELIDLSSPLLIGVTVTCDPTVAFKDIDLMIALASGIDIEEGMTRAIFLNTSIPIYISHGQYLEKYAKKTVKVLVIGNSCNTMACLMSESAPSIPKKNFTALSRLDHNRTKAQLAVKIGVPCSSIKKCIVWGDHSSSMTPDVEFAIAVTEKEGEKPVKKLIKDEKYWERFTTLIQGRGMEVFRLRKRTSALSSAKASVDHINSWFCGTPEGDYVSMAVLSDGSYCVSTKVYFSFPCTCKDGEYTIVNDLKVDPTIAEKIKITSDKLVSEINLVHEESLVPKK